MKSKTVKFAKERYLNGFQNKRSVNQNWEMIKLHLRDMIEKHVPSKTARTQKQPPWITQRVRRLVRKRNKTHARAKKFKSSRLKQKWKNIRAQIKTETNIAHDTYVNDMIGNISDNPKPFWRYINSEKQGKHSIPS